MTHTPLWTSTAFRLALAFTALFLLSSLALFGFIYWSTTGHMLRQADVTINAEIQGLAERYREDGAPGLSRIIADRLAGNRAYPTLYLLADRRLRPLLGNLDAWPDLEPNEDGWLDFPMGGFGADGRDSHHAHARVFRLSGGLNLLVGRDMRELDEADARLLTALAWGALITTLIGLAGGALLSRVFLRRIGAVNATAREIMLGDLSRRIPTTGSGDDLDHLAQNLNAMLDRIQELMEDIRRVSDNIAHDLRTPLARLRTRLEELAADRAGGEGDELAVRCLADADTLLSTFSALLRIARIEAGDRKAGFAEVELSAVCADAAELYQPLAEDAGLEFVADIEAGIHIRGDRDLLFQALANLLDNAVKYSAAGGRVRLRLERELDSTVRITVADNGRGIPEDEREEVFKRFYRSEKNRGSPGAGLGLSLVAAVADLHGTRIQLTDNGPGLRARWDFPAA